MADESLRNRIISPESSSRTDIERLSSASNWSRNGRQRNLANERLKRLQSTLIKGQNERKSKGKNNDSLSKYKESPDSTVAVNDAAVNNKSNQLTENYRRYKSSANDRLKQLQCQLINEQEDKKNKIQEGKNNDFSYFKKQTATKECGGLQTASGFNHSKQFRDEKPTTSAVPYSIKSSEQLDFQKKRELQSPDIFSKRKKIETTNTSLLETLKPTPVSKRFERYRHKTPTSTDTMKNVKEISEAAQQNAQTDSRVFEAMDWQPIKDEIVNAFDNFNGSGFAHDKSPSPDFGLQECKFFNDINKNLLNLLRENQNSFQLHLDRFYFILDTNVLLHHLDFVKYITTTNFCGTNGSTIYIPYIIIAELDKLKMHKSDKSLQFSVTQAIRYINKKFNSVQKCIQAQSALSDDEHLFELKSADDHIINCCLQLKAKINMMVLLTEDVNLRNKAISCGLWTTAVTELLNTKSFSKSFAKGALKIV